MNAKGYRCANCGNMLPISWNGVMKCPSCGSQYKEEGGMLSLVRVEKIPFESTTIAGRVIIDPYLFYKKPEAAFELSLKRMASNMAEQIMPLMEVETYYDHARAEYEIRGRIRVAVPSRRPEEVIQQAIVERPDIVCAAEVGGITDG